MPAAHDSLYRRHRFPPEVISYAVWLYFRFPLSLRMVEEMLAARGICVTYETVRQWGKKFGRAFCQIGGREEWRQGGLGVRVKIRKGGSPRPKIARNRASAAA